MLLASRLAEPHPWLAHCYFHSVFDCGQCHGRWLFALAVMIGLTQMVGKAELHFDPADTATLVILDANTTTSKQSHPFVSSRVRWRRSAG